MSDRFVVGETTGFLEPGRSLGGHSPNHQKNRRSAEPRTIFVCDRLNGMRVLREWRTETTHGKGLRSNLERIKRIRAEAAEFITGLEETAAAGHLAEGQPAAADRKEV